MVIFDEDADIGEYTKNVSHAIDLARERAIREGYGEHITRKGFFDKYL